jgi:hypothetical protein
MGTSLNPRAGLHRVAAALAAATLCTACTTNSSNPTAGGRPDAVTAAQTVDEYVAESSKLILPPNRHWLPKAPSSVGPDGAPQVYQRGYGAIRADFDWYCSWEIRFLDAKIGPAEKDAAYSTLKTVRNTPYYQTSLLPDDKKLFDKQLNDAGLGDTAAMQNDANSNCSKAGT